eukprot:g8267.t1
MPKKKKKAKAKMDARGYSTAPGAATVQPDPEEMHACARYGEDDDIVTLRVLLHAGTPVDHVDTLGSTALHKACANGHVEIVRALIEGGASHFANASGNTPLHWAVQNGHLDVVKSLLDASKPPADGGVGLAVDVLARNGFGKSVLSEGFGGQNEDVTALLLQHDSCDEQRLKAGTSTQDLGAVQEEAPEDGDGDGDAAAAAAAAAPAAAGHATQSKVVQRATLQFCLGAGKDGAGDRMEGGMEGGGGSPPLLAIQEVGIDWAGESFADSSAAEEDTTGLQVW